MSTWTVAPFPRRRGGIGTAELVKLLALAPRHGRHREQLIEALWPDLSPDSGGKPRKAAHDARRALGARIGLS